MDVLAVLGIKRTPNQDILEQIKQQKLAVKKAKDEATNVIGQLLRSNTLLNNPINTAGQDIISSLVNQSRAGFQQQVTPEIQAIKNLVSGQVTPQQFGAGEMARAKISPLLQPENLQMAGLNIAGALRGSSVTDDLANAMARQRANNVLDDVTNLAKKEPINPLKQLPAPKGVVVDPLAKFKKKENLVKVDPVLEIKKQITARDIQGNKVELPAGEALTPYELKGNKYLLKDGNEYIVNKNQYQNIKGNAVKAEAQPFAPELEQTTETVKGVDLKNAEKEYLEYKKAMTKKYKTDISPKWPLDVQNELYKLEGLTTHPTNPTKFSQYTLPGGENYREVLIQAPAERMTVTRPDGSKFNEALSPNNFTSSHWEEPNVLAHVRLNDRTYNGKPVTFIEEIQSDWAREARKGGEKTPSNPLLKNWQELAAKRALKDAVDNGSEYLAWTTGEQQAARYDLSKQIEKINWEPLSQGGKQVIIKPIDSTQLVAHIDKNGIITNGHGGIPSNWIGKRIDEAVGKGVGEKIMTGGNRGTIKGEGLKIGGEWANNLYNRQLPNIIEKLTGQKPELIRLNTGKEFATYEELPKEAQKLVDLFDAEKIKPPDFISRMSKYGYEVNLDMDGGLDKIIDLKASPGQMGIKLTPQVKAKVKGEAPPVKQPSGKNPFLGLGGLGLGLYGLQENNRRKQNLLTNYLGM